MTSSTPALTLESARSSISERSFRGATGNRVGVELEWFTTPSDRPPSVETLRTVLGDLALPGSSALTFEPGAQVELSSAVFDTCAEACNAIAADAQVVRRSLAEHGIGLFACGSDHQRPLALRTDHPRYVAMRRFFDTFGPAGGRMMCGSAAIHVNLDAGDDDEGRERWRAAHVVGPALVAAFANSPCFDGVPTGWKSSRFEAWKELDGTRTAPVEGADDPVTAWADYVLAARVMFIGRGDVFEPILDHLTFAEWIERGHALGFPTEADLAYHETTLFPPIRTRGWIELRMMDMLPDPWWRAAVAVAAAVVTDPDVRTAAVDACTPTISMWETAALRGLDDLTIRRAVDGLFDAALSGMDRSACGPGAATIVEAYADRYIRRGRTPADEQLERPVSSSVRRTM